MKMTRIIRSLLVALVCLAGLSSCEEVEQTTIMYGYSVEGKVSGGSIGTLLIISEYTEAIKKLYDGFTWGLVSKDKEVIAACDAVYNSQSSRYSDLQGSLILYRKEYGENSEVTASKELKTYTFVKR